MRVTIDTTEARSFELAEPGPYGFTIASMSEPRSTENTTGTDVEFRFEDPALEQKCGNITRFYPIKGKGAGFFREMWKAATGVDIPIGAVIDVDFDDAIGRRVIGEVTNVPSQKDPTKIYNQINSVISGS